MKRYFYKIVVQQIGGGRSRARVVLQTEFDELLSFSTQRVRNGRRSAHAHFEHDLIVGIVLGPRSLRTLNKIRYWPLK